MLFSVLFVWKVPKPIISSLYWDKKYKVSLEIDLETDLEIDTTLSPALKTLDLRNSFFFFFLIIIICFPACCVLNYVSVLILNV